MKLYTLVIDCEPVLTTFSPVAIVERLEKESRFGERPIVLNIDEVK